MTLEAFEGAVERGDHVMAIRPGPFGGIQVQNGLVEVEGPQGHGGVKWRAIAAVQDGFVVEVM